MANATANASAGGSRKDPPGKTMKKMNKAILELNVRGTPAIYDANFEPVSQDKLLKAGAKGNKK